MLLLALTEEEKNEELGVIMVPDHIVLTVDEKEKLFEGNVCSYVDNIYLHIILYFHSLLFTNYESPDQLP